MALDERKILGARQVLDWLYEQAELRIKRCEQPQHHLLLHLYSKPTSSQEVPDVEYLMPLVFCSLPDFHTAEEELMLIETTAPDPSQHNGITPGCFQDGAPDLQSPSAGSFHQEEYVEKVF
jgi:hypothetical protein